jgi:hypothetical protein
MARSRERIRLKDGLKLDLNKLDLNKLIRDGLVKPGERRQGFISWRTGTDQTVASGVIEVDLQYEPCGWLHLTLNKLTQGI